MSGLKLRWGGGTITPAGVRLRWGGSSATPSGIYIRVGGSWVKVWPLAPLAASIGGNADYIVANGTANLTFTASASGGTAPYSYAWSLSGSGTGTSISGSANGVSVTVSSTGTNRINFRTLNLTVTDALGASVTRSKEISIQHGTAD